jgi:hypothetical protein
MECRCDGGWIVRCGYSDEENLLMSQVEKTPDAATARAAEWKQAAIAKGFAETLADR